MEGEEEARGHISPLPRFYQKKGGEELRQPSFPVPYADNRFSRHRKRKEERGERGEGGGNMVFGENEQDRKKSAWLGTPPLRSHPVLRDSTALFPSASR